MNKLTVINCQYNYSNIVREPANVLLHQLITLEGV